MEPGARPGLGADLRLALRAPLGLSFFSCRRQDSAPAVETTGFPVQRVPDSPEAPGLAALGSEEEAREGVGSTGQLRQHHKIWILPPPAQRRRKGSAGCSLELRLRGLNPRKRSLSVP